MMLSNLSSVSSHFSIKICIFLKGNIKRTYLVICEVVIGRLYQVILFRIKDVLVINKKSCFKMQ